MDSSLWINLPARYIRDTAVHTIADSWRIQKFSTVESGFKKLQIRLPDSLDSGGRKLYPEKKNLRIQKYPDTFGRGLKIIIFIRRKF